MKIIDDITEFIFVENPPQNADIIFIPGGSQPELGELAASLFIKGYAPLVMPSGGVSINTGKFGGVKSKKDIYNKEYATDCEFLTDVLEISGVPSDAIIQENKSGWTGENALFSGIVADQKGLKINKAIICCQAFHARRCLMCYQLAFSDTEFIVVPAVTKNISRTNWNKSEYGIERVLGELARCGNQLTDDIKKFLLTRCFDD